MSKKRSWWHRSPDDEDDSNEDVDENNDEKRFDRSKRFKRRPPYGDRREDWSPFGPRFFRSPFDSEFDRIFSRSPFGPRDDIFSDMEREFEEMHVRMDKIFKDAMDGKLEKPGKEGPYVYGFSMRTGPDGIPHIQEFGNVRPEMLRGLKGPDMLPLRGSSEIPTKLEETEVLQREPLTDIMEHDKDICITMELPGIEKKDIDLNVEEDQLIVQVDTPIRKYFKKLPLPTELDPKSISAHYNNGVLDVILNRLSPKPKKGRKIKID